MLHLPLVPSSSYLISQSSFWNFTLETSPKVGRLYFWFQKEQNRSTKPPPFLPFPPFINAFKTSMEITWFLSEPKLPPEGLRNWVSRLPVQKQTRWRCGCAKWAIWHPLPEWLSFFLFFSHQRENPCSCCVCKRLCTLCPSYTSVHVLNANMRVFLFAHAIAEAACK